MTWLEKYELLLNEDLGVTQMMKLLGQKHEDAKALQTKILLDLRAQGIKLPNERRIPTELILKALNKDLKYYEVKMMQEVKLRKIKEDLNHEKKEV